MFGIFIGVYKYRSKLREVCWELKVVFVVINLEWGEYVKL